MNKPFYLAASEVSPCICTCIGDWIDCCLHQDLSNPPLGLHQVQILNISADLSVLSTVCRFIVHNHKSATTHADVILTDNYTQLAPVLTVPISDLNSKL